MVKSTKIRPKCHLKENCNAKKSISYKRAFKMLENDTYITGIGQAVLK